MYRVECKGLYLKRLLFLVVCSVIVSFFVRSYIHHEDGVYWWDFRGYQDLYNFYCPRMLYNWHVFRRFVKSLYRDDYGPLSLLPMNIGHILWGSGRFSFVYSIYIFWILPLACFFHKVINQYIAPEDKIKFVYTVLMVLCFSPLWGPVLRGYPDIGGCVPFTVALLLIYQTKFLTVASVRNCLLLGVMLWLMFALRRWYAFSIMAFMICSFGFALFEIRECESKNNYILLLKNYTISSLTLLFCVFVFQLRLFIKILRTSYVSSYEIYQLPLSEQILHVIYPKIGPVILVLLFSGLLISFVKKNKYILFCGCVAFLTIYLFSRVQSPSEQHMLPVYFLCLLICVYCIRVFSSFFSKKKRNLLFLLFIFYEVLGGGYVFSEKFHNNTVYGDYIFPSWTLFPIKLGNKVEYKSLINDLKIEMGKEGTFTVFPANMSLNIDLLIGVDSALKEHAIFASEVDQRDFFRLNVLDANIAVVMVPISGKGCVPWTVNKFVSDEKKAFNGQQVAIIPNEAIVNGTGIGASYRQIGRGYAIVPGYVAFLYRRIKPANGKDVQWLLKEFIKRYPNWKIYSDKIGM